MKKSIIALIALIIVSSAVLVGAVAQSGDVPLILGDVNLDLKVNIKDATVLQKYLAKLSELSPQSKTCADCDGDSKLSIKDATWIQKFLAGIYCPYKIAEEIITSDPSSEATSTADTLFRTEYTSPEESYSHSMPLSTCEPSELSTQIISETASETTTTASFSEDTKGEGIILPDDVFTDPTESETIPVTDYTPEKPNPNITVYFSDNVNWGKANAYLYNDQTLEELSPWPGKAMTFDSVNSMGESIYSLTVDASRFNRIVFNNGKSQTLNAALTVASSGFYVTRQTPKNAMQLGVYTYGAENYGSKQTVYLSYPAGYNKPIEIWTPADYNPKGTSKKYSVIYLLDGQNQFDDSDAYEGGWASDETVTSLMKNGGDGIILVGIDNTVNRDNELTPDIGELISEYNSGGFKNGTGEEFAEFVANTVVPYVEANYNVYTDASHRAIVGSSSGGLEAFYIGMEYINDFGCVGAVSPAFMLFDENTWMAYFEKFDFENAASLPRIYIYNGGGDELETELLSASKKMKSLLESLGYDESKIKFVYDEKNAHNEAAWRNIFPEAVTWLFELQ